VFHYHRSIDDRGFLTATMHSNVNEWFERFNQARADALGLPFDGMAPMPFGPRMRAWVRGQPWYRGPRRWIEARRKGRR
jgi:hypothetical protein